MRLLMQTLRAPTNGKPKHAAKEHEEADPSNREHCSDEGDHDAVGAVDEW